MSVTPIEGSSPVWPVAPTLSEPADNVQGAGGFEQMILKGIAEVNGQLSIADSHLQNLASGKSENVHEAMLAMEQARLSFQFLAQVRNRFMDAYQQLMQMQI